MSRRGAPSAAVTDEVQLAPDPVASVAELLREGPPVPRDALSKRLRTLLTALGPSVSCPRAANLMDLVERALTGATPDKAWLALSVTTGRLPEPAEVLRLVRAIRLDGPRQAFCQALDEHRLLDATCWPDVEVVTGQVLIDLHHTARNLFATGIQRVAREAGRRWARDHEVILVGWTRRYLALRRLSAEESCGALEGALAAPPPEAEEAPDDTDEPDPRDVLVPWQCTHVVPELPAESERAPRYQAFVMFSGSTTGLIGHDCVPVTAAETCAKGMSLGFSRYLAAAAHVDRIATTSDSSTTEYAGWRAMLGGAGRSGPDIRRIPLPVSARPPAEAAMAEARELLAMGPLPIVLAVGSHEPRKNHLALLHAAEILWREGLRFTLAFVGGNSWNSDTFTAQVDMLRQVNRPIQTILGLSDDLLWAAYRLAYCTVFPSLHEGFGLPVAESLSSGTPVITSNFGSMREIASGGGALLINPRRDHELVDALRRLLLDTSLRDRLAKEASRTAQRSWDQYAAEAWTYFVEGPTSSR